MFKTGKNKRIKETGQIVPYLTIGCLFFASCAYPGTTSYKCLSDTTRVKNDLQSIINTPVARNYRNIAALDQVAAYIHSELKKTCDTVYFQYYQVDGQQYKNVVGCIGLDKTERIIVGAHYDVEGHQDGADDNASGVAGLLELSRMLSGERLNYRIDFVAYTLEEPPYFRTENMGSHVHAKSIYDQNVKVKGMICLEMIGYFNDRPHSQTYPLKMLRMVYGDKGDYIVVVQKYGNGQFGRQVKRLMKKPGLIPTKSFRGTVSLPGIDFSDHRNYWAFGYSAVMVTNTSFYRNKNYHKTTDKMETLDVKRMALVIDQLFYTIKALGG